MIFFVAVAIFFPFRFTEKLRLAIVFIITQQGLSEQDRNELLVAAGIRDSPTANPDVCDFINCSKRG